MKKTLILGVLFGTSLIFSACSEAVKKEEKIEMVSYGPAKVDQTKAVSVDELISEMNKTKEDTEFTIEAEISEVCNAAGCWINIKKADGSSLMARFKDHFTIPTKTKIGTKAFLSGIAYWDTITVEMRQHFAEDAGKTKEEIAQITEPSFELSFEADGITFEKPKK
ncbi:MAG: DUF4920 domain-containing protein [Bacteroidota bacterium]